MRCSSCETLLDRYLEASLEPARAAAVAEHLRGCVDCEALLGCLRVVDGLLATVRDREIEPDFTFDVMKRMRTLPAPAAPRRPLLPLAAFYLVAAWIAVGAALSVAWRGVPLQLPAIAHAAAGTLAALEHGTRALWPVEPIAFSVVVSLLSIDALLFAAVVIFYRNVRPRLTAYLAATVEAS